MPNLRCNKCKNDIPEKAKFCPQCGDPITEADKFKNQDSKLETIRLVCPKCETRNLYKSDISDQMISLKCPQCNTTFQSQIAKIRSKKSRVSKRYGRRSFGIRIQDFTGNEHFIEFENADYKDFELRAKDIAAFSYLNTELRIVQNMTVDQYIKITKPFCFIASYIYGSTSTEVAILRQWRDQILLSSDLGTKFVRIYYKVGPFLVILLGKNNMIYKLVKLILGRFVIFINKKNLITNQFT